MNLPNGYGSAAEQPAERASILDHKSHDEVFEDIFGWADAKTIFSFYLDNIYDYDSNNYVVGEKAWDLLTFEMKHKIAEAFIKSVAVEAFVDQNIEKYEEEMAEIAE